MKKEKKVLLIINPQNGFKHKNTKTALSNIDKIVDYFDTVFVSKFINPNKSMYKDLLFWYQFSKHKNKNYFELAIKENKKFKFTKTHKYGNLTFKIKLYLKLHKIDTVYLCGLETDASIYKTSLDLFDMGIKPIVIKDACGSRRSDLFHKSALKLICRQIGEDQVLTFEELRNKLEPKIVEFDI